MFFLVFSRWVHEKERQNNDKVRVTEWKPQKSRNSFACFPANWASRYSLLRWLIFLLPHTKTCQFKWFIVWQILTKKCLFYSKQHFEWSFFLRWAKISNNGRVQFCSIVKSEAFSCFPKKAFWTLDLYKNILDRDGLKCELKSINGADFAKQALTIQEVAEILQEFGNMGIWTKPSSERNNQNSMSDSDQTWHIFQWEIVFFTKACK